MKHFKNVSAPFYTYGSVPDFLKDKVNKSKGPVIFYSEKNTSIQIADRKSVNTSDEVQLDDVHNKNDEEEQEPKFIILYSNGLLIDNVFHSNDSEEYDDLYIKVANGELPVSDENIEQNFVFLNKKSEVYDQS